VPPFWPEDTRGLHRRIPGFFLEALLNPQKSFNRLGMSMSPSFLLSHLVNLVRSVLPPSPALTPSDGPPPPCGSFFQTSACVPAGPLSHASDLIPPPTPYLRQLIGGLRWQLCWLLPHLLPGCAPFLRRDVFDDSPPFRVSLGLSATSQLEVLLAHPREEIFV